MQARPGSGWPRPPAATFWPPRIATRWLWMFIVMLASVATPLTRLAGQTLALDPAALTFSSTPAQPTPPSQTVAIRNTGSATLSNVTLSPVTYAPGQPTGWLTRNVGNSTVSPRERESRSAANIGVYVDPGTLPAGTYRASYQVSAANSTNGPLTETVTFTVAGPTLALDPAALTFSSTPAQPTPPSQTVAIRNTGSATLSNVTLSPVTYAPGQPTGWLSRDVGNSTVVSADIESRRRPPPSACTSTPARCRRAPTARRTRSRPPTAPTAR